MYLGTGQHRGQRRAVAVATTSGGGGGGGGGGDDKWRRWRVPMWRHSGGARARQGICRCAAPEPPAAPCASSPAETTSSGSRLAPSTEPVGPFGKLPARARASCRGRQAAGATRSALGKDAPCSAVSLKVPRLMPPCCPLPLAGPMPPASQTVFSCAACKQGRPVVPSTGPRSDGLWPTRRRWRGQGGNRVGASRHISALLVPGHPEGGCIPFHARPPALQLAK